MKKRAIVLLVLLMALTLQIAEAEPMLYRVNGEKGTLYLLPTIHFGNEEMVSALETRVLPTVKNADRLAVEIDDAVTQSMSGSLRLNLAIRYDNKEIASNHLARETYEQAKALLKRAGMDYSMFDGIRAQYWPALCENAICMLGGMRADQGVDRIVMKYARENGVNIEGMETVDEQITLLLSPSDALTDWLLQETVSDPDAAAARYAAMPAMFVAGDGETLYAANKLDLSGVPADIEEEARQYYDMMLRQRDDRFEERAVRYLSEDKTTVLMVGALHIIGENGLIDRLQNAGYQVELLK